MDTGIFFMKKDSEIYRGFWYRSNTPSIQKDNKIFYIPLHKDFFSKNGIQKDILINLGYEIETYILKDKNLSNEFKFLIFYHVNTLSENISIEHIFNNVLGDFIETYYSEILNDFRLVTDRNLISNKISFKIDKNIQKILELCTRYKLLKKKTIQKVIQKTEERSVSESDIIKKIFSKL